MFLIAGAVVADAPTSNQLWILLGVLITASGTFFAAVYGKSGRIARTEAETLWKQNQQEKEEMREDIKNLRLEVVAVNVRNATLVEDHYDCRTQLSEVRRENGDLKRRIEQLERRQ